MEKQTAIYGGEDRTVVRKEALVGGVACTGVQNPGGKLKRSVCCS